MSIIVYSTYCPKCKVIETKMKKKNVEFDIVDNIDDIKAKGFNNVPVVEIDGEYFDFSTTNQLLNHFDSSTTFEEFVISTQSE